jgi:hypothetical protein
MNETNQPPFVFAADLVLVNRNGGQTKVAFHMPLPDCGEDAEERLADILREHLRPVFVAARMRVAGKKEAEDG